ncbi:MAG: hypothetical protein M3256_19605 [Actinomycetota bacterium]|nr:hypothetical protein [Actinomycetota bacterium]
MVGAQACHIWANVDQISDGQLSSPVHDGTAMDQALPSNGHASLRRNDHPSLDGCVEPDFPTAKVPEDEYSEGVARQPQQEIHGDHVHVEGRILQSDQSTC